MGGGVGKWENHLEEIIFKKVNIIYGIKMTQMSLLNNHEPNILLKHNIAG